MKVEFQCQQCRSTLRLGAEHLGKNVRCPVCGGITNVEGTAKSTPAASPNQQPLTSQSPKSLSGWQSLSPPASQGSDGVELVHPQVQSIEASTKASSNDSNPYQSATVQNPTPWSSSSDGFWWAGFWCSIGSIASCFLSCCCFIGPLASIVLAFASIVATLFSRTGPKWVNFLLAAIGGGIAVLFGLISILGLLIGH